LGVRIPLGVPRFYLPAEAGFFYIVNYE